jgi:hypothetical protein
VKTEKRLFEFSVLHRCFALFAVILCVFSFREIFKTQRPQSSANGFLHFAFLILHDYL